MSKLTILRGDNRQTLQQIPAGTIQTVVTSPPYWAVRDYGTDPVDFPAVTFTPAVGLPDYTAPAWRGQMGLEPDPWWFIAHLLESFRAIRRVLRDDGTIWVNLGDTYYTGAGGVGECPGGGRKASARKHYIAGSLTTPNRLPIPGMKPKDLVGIPWMFAKAMQADGWTLRGDIIWHKPNPMPGSQKDRPTTAHEYLFLFSASEDYFYDNQAVKEPTTSDEPGGGCSTWNAGDTAEDLKGRHLRPSVKRGGFNGKTEAMADDRRNAFRATRLFREKRSGWTIPTQGYKGAHFATFPEALVVPCILAGTSAKGACSGCGAPWRPIVVSIESGDTKVAGWRPTCVCGADPSLGLKPDDMVTFETPTGEQLGDDECLTRGRRGMERESLNTGKRLITRYEHRHYARQLLKSPHRKAMEAQAADLNGADAFEHYTRTDRSGARPIPPELLGEWIERGYLTRVDLPEWTPLPTVPCKVLEPFGGSGTTAKVALEHGREAVVCEIADHYVPLIEERTTVTPGLALA